MSHVGMFVSLVAWRPSLVPCELCHSLCCLQLMVDFHQLTTLKPVGLLSPH